MRTASILFLLALTASGTAGAQSSASYRLSEHTFNAGGHPEQGSVMAATSHRVTVDAIGEGIDGIGLSSASYRMDAGFGAAYPAPGEVRGLRFVDSQTLAWDPEKSVGTYNLYRGLLSALAGLGYGACEQQDLGSEIATDPAGPPTQDGYVYLVTAENRLAEEGTKGWDTQGSERANAAPCP